jgi:GR25 family glycosyltransferase involved in LPS biosynthesis
VYRLSATLNKKNGHLGCADSHIRALKYAKDKGLRNVLIMEDDVSLDCSPAKFNKKVSGFLEKYGNDYDAITFFGYWKKGIVPVDNDVGRFNEDGYSTTALAYMVNQRAYNDFLRVFTDAKIKMTQELKSFNGEKKFETPYAIDVHWKTLQRGKKFYIFNPHIVKPSGSYSEIMLK